MKQSIEKYDTIYIKFRIGEQTAFLREIKEKCFNTWDKMASFLGVNRSMIFFYLNEKHKLPKSSFCILSNISDINPKKFSFKSVPFSIYGSAIIPYEVNPLLAEFIGIMLGDGSLYRFNHQITISCGEIDGTYITEHIPKMIKTLFSKKVSFRKIAKGGLDCRFSSKKVSEYLTREMGFKSPKTNCKIPLHFFDDDNLLKACVRGLFDTDGGLHRHHERSAQLHFTNKSKTLIYSLHKALKKLGFNPSNITINHKEKNTHALYLFNKDVKKYFNEIGSNNPKNQIKFNYWIQKGKVPLNFEIEKEVKLKDKEQERLLNKKTSEIKIIGVGKIRNI